MQTDGGENEEWERKLSRPEVWEPTFEQHDDVITIRFHTFSGLGQVTTYRWSDMYKLGYYRFETTEEVVAEGSGGFVF